MACKKRRGYSEYRGLIMYADTLIGNLLGLYREDLILEILHFMFDASQLDGSDVESVSVQYKILHALKGVLGNPTCYTSLMYDSISPKEFSEYVISSPADIEAAFAGIADNSSFRTSFSCIISLNNESTISV